MSSSVRLGLIRHLLIHLGRTPFFRTPHCSDQIFELYCYFRKLEDFVNRGKRATLINVSSGSVFFLLILSQGILDLLTIFL